MSDISFSRKKFLSFPKEQQHKKCAEILRVIYEKLLLKQYVVNLFNSYNALLKYLELDEFNSKDLKKISDQYHFHLNLASVTLKEHNLLPTLRTLDGNRDEKPFLENAIYLDNLRSAYNVGNIIRTTEALRIEIGRAHV